MMKFNRTDNPRAGTQKGKGGGGREGEREGRNGAGGGGTQDQQTLSTGWGKNHPKELKVTVPGIVAIVNSRLTLCWTHLKHLKSKTRKNQNVFK